MAFRDRLGAVDADTLRTLVLGDLLVLAAFIVAGEHHHGFPLTEVPGRVALVALPFLLGWLAFGSLFGAYSRGILDAPGALLATTLLGWTAADAFGQLLRGTEALPGNADPVFFAVMFGVGTLALLGWRGARLLVRRRT